jgi:formylglycine-generating enzyme required for sulfatase activity
VKVRPATFWFLASSLAGACGFGETFHVDADADASSDGGADGPFDTVSLGDGGGDTTEGDSGAGDGGAPLPCTATRGATQIRVSQGATTFCIDATEVTRAQYDAFLTAGSNVAAQPAACARNTSFVPVASWPYNASTANMPVVGVDWCDARAYCAWAGKRLCGRIGGGVLTVAELADPTKSEWYNACSRGGLLAYPYGNAFDASACSGAQIAVVGSFVGCNGGYAGIFDMSGNAHEWIDACITTGGDAAADPCAMSGSGYIHPAAEMRCDFFVSIPRGATSGSSVGPGEGGFRCCGP